MIGPRDLPRNYRYLDCRDLGHYWVPTEVNRKDVPLGFRRRHVQCERCTTRKTQVITRTGDVDRTSYRYPKGYRLHKMGRREVAWAARKIMVRLANRAPRWLNVVAPVTPDAAAS